MNRQITIIRNMFILTSTVIFISSLTVEAYCTTSFCRPSIDAFIMGVFGFFSGGAAMTWIANPLLIASWILAYIKKTRSSLMLSVLSTLITLSFMRFTYVIDNEAGHLNKIVSYNWGYWLWVASATIMLIGNLLILLYERRLGFAKAQR